MKPRVYFPCEAQKVKTILWRHIKWTVLASEQCQALCWAFSDILSFSSVAPASQPFPRLQNPISSQPLNKFPLRTPTGTSSAKWWTSPLHPLPTFTSAQVHPARQIGKLFTNILKPRVLEPSRDPLPLSFPWAILQWRSMSAHACLSQDRFSPPHLAHPVYTAGLTETPAEFPPLPHLQAWLTHPPGSGFKSQIGSHQCSKFSVECEMVRPL